MLRSLSFLDLCIVWWLIAQVLGWITLPVAMRFFRWLPDRGLCLLRSRWPAAGQAISSGWGASTGFLRNDLGGYLFADPALARAGRLCLAALSPHKRGFIGSRAEPLLA